MLLLAVCIVFSTIVCAPSYCLTTLATTLNKTDDTGKIPITISNSFPLINTQIGCGADSASLEIDMDTQVNVEIDLGFTIAGTLIPPKISEVRTNRDLYDLSHS